MKNLQKLKAEQARLKQELVEREQNINEHIHYLEKNFGRMALNSALPFGDAQREKVNGLLDQANNFIFKLLPTGKLDEEKTNQYKGLLHTLQLAVAGIAYRSFKKLF